MAQMYKKYHIFDEKINIYNMVTYLKRYPLSILVIAAILYLSFFKPPQTSISEIKNIDKIVHICMYCGLTVILWTEHIRQHFPLIRKHIIIGGVVCPIIMSGLIEIGQATLTETRGGDWMDFLANIVGVLLGSLFSYYVLRPYIWKKQHDK